MNTVAKILPMIPKKMCSLLLIPISNDLNAHFLPYYASIVVGSWNERDSSHHAIQAVHCEACFILNFHST